MPFAGYENFAACVVDQRKKGHSEESARRICGKLQAEAEGENRGQESEVRSLKMAEKDKDDSTRMYLIVDENGEGHLKVRNSPEGPLDHGLMGGAWAALHGGYRGKKYEGPDKEKAIAKLKRLYAEENMPLPSDRATERGPSVLLDRLPKAIFAEGKEFYEIPLMPTGKWQRFTVEARQIDEMVKNFAANENGMLPIDYEHAMELLAEEPGLARGGPIPAAGWIHKLRRANLSSIKSSLKEALIATVEFTKRAVEMIRSGEYRFISPAWTFESTDRLSGEERGARLLSAALTNKPFFTELPPLKASEFGTGDSGTSPESQTLNPESRQGGTNVEKLTARKTNNGLEILKGTELIGSLELEPEVDETPILARFAESIGAKGKTEVEIKQLVESGVKFTGREAQDAAFRLLATECVKDGKLDRDKMKLLARDQKASVEQFFTFEDAWGKVDAAVKLGKILPKSRDHALRIALSDAPAFDALMADAKPIVPLRATGLAGAGRQPSEAVRPKNISTGKEVVNADRVARIHALQEESAKAGKKLGYLEAHAIVLSEEQAAGIDGNGQAA